MQLAQRVQLNSAKSASANHNSANNDTYSGDAAHCANGLTASKFRESTGEERATYRKWIRGMVVFYCTLLVASGVMLFVSSGGSLTQVSNLPGNHAMASSRPD